MKNVGIAKRLYLFLGAFVVVAVGCVGGFSFLLTTSSSASRGAVDRTRVKSQASFDLVENAARVQGLTLRLVREKDADAIETFLKESESVVRQAQARIQEVGAQDSRVNSSFAALIAADEKVKQHILLGQHAEAQQKFIEESNPAFEALLNSIKRYQDDSSRLLDQEISSAATRVTVIQTTITLIVGLGVLAVTGFGVALAGTIARSLRHLLARVQDVAQGDGDLTKRLDVTSNDEIGELAHWFNVFLEKLHSVMLQVTTNTHRLATASEEISAAATEQAQGSETQKDQTAQVATAMQEMSSTVLQVTENSNKAAGAARQAADTARHGGTVVEETLVRMRAISESVTETAQKVKNLGKSSDAIGEIIGVIDDIADQTNLLALNAAIEAARAGEQGRGFAVVADEVRKLAERTSKATKEIAAMIKSIQVETKNAVAAMKSGTEQVELGVNSTSAAGKSLGEIIRMAEQVGDMITHIATASTQQSTATGEVNNTIEQISKITQESAAGAHQSARACHELSNLALDLQNLVGQFKVDSAAPKQSLST